MEVKAERIQALLRADHLNQPPELVAAHAATTAAAVAVITAFTARSQTLQAQAEACFGRHPDAEIYRSQPGLGEILGARVLGEFGDDPDRYQGARARKNYAGSAPITRASGQQDGRAGQVRAQPTPRRIAAIGRRSARCAPHPAPAPTTTSSAPAAPGIRPRCANSATAWSGILHGLPQDPHPLRRAHRLGPPQHYMINKLRPDIQRHADRLT